MCVICQTEVRLMDALHTPCNHHYCSDCLKTHIERYLQDEYYHPLRCCVKNHFSEDDVSTHLRNDHLFAQYKAKRLEYEVPAQSRVYCSVLTCSTFLGSANTTPAGNANKRCITCGAYTCARCRKPSHFGETCTGNVAVEQVRKLARQEGWQTCPGCLTVVDLHHGCNHMTCSCRTEFCFVCGVKWKNCLCPQWDEARLEATTDRRVRNDLGRTVATNAPVYMSHFARMRENLRANHRCGIHTWTPVGPGNCEECGRYSGMYMQVSVT